MKSHLMKKANKKTIEKLKPYWKKYQEKREVFDREIIQLEKEMNELKKRS